MAPYRLTRETKRIGNKVLYRIQATAPIEKLGVESGDLGGWIESEANLSQGGSCWVGDDATVMDEATVVDNAVVAGSAFVHQSAKINDFAKVYDNAEVSGRAYIMGSAEIFEDARITGNPLLGGDTRVSGNTVIKDTFSMWGDAVIESEADFLYISGFYEILLYRTEEGFSGLPDVELPEPVQALVELTIESWNTGVYPWS